MKLIVGAWLAMLLIALSGCSIKLAYNNADRLIRWGIDDYVDLTREQRAFLNPELKRLLYWHRTTQLPRYATTLRTLQADIDRAVGSDGVALSEDFGAFIETALSWGELVQEKAQRAGSQVLISLTQRQIDALPRRLAADNKDLAKDERGKSLEASQKRWAKEVRKGLQRFTGRLTDQQRSYLARQAEYYEPERELWVAYRQRWQEDVLALLTLWRDREIDAQTLVQRFRALADARESYYGDFGPVFERNEVLSRDTLAGLLVRMNPAQRKRFARGLQSIAQDLDELVAQAKPEPPAPLMAGDCLAVHPDCPGIPINP